MYPQQPAQRAAARRKKPNRTLLLVLVSVLGVLALCLVVTVVYGVTNDRKKVNTDSAAAPAATSDRIPPAPDAATTAAYIAALRAIDPDIVGDKDERTIVNRGRDQCGSVKDSPTDQAKLVELTNKRFTSPKHPEGFGAEKATQILAVVRQHICPTY